jgi:Asp-tRNA(Asn)/Glu-tRNA(Gln) amidotransferase A subunit family amidase
LADTRHRLQAAGIDVVDRTSHDATAAVETAIAGAAPVGLDWTGNPIFTVATSLLGVPSLSLPVFEDDGLPLGLQLIGFTDRDADLFSAAGAIIALFRDWS